MQIGMIDLRRMGANMARRLIRKPPRKLRHCAIPRPVLTAALYERFSSRGEADFANQLLSAMRSEFSGDLEKSDGKSKVA